ncbi:MAG: hypothetical protein M1333_01970 [Patescibacteria group bacterium]|nr:hypothetical protein [Patescibacteria group bacterium]
MKDYEEIKKVLSENRTRVVLAAAYVLVFLLGFGVGRYDQEWQKRLFRMQNNYNTKTVNLQKDIKNPEGEAPAKAAANATSSPVCVIKGNISSQGKKIFHVRGGSFYDRVNPEQCFSTEEEAVAAGFVKSSR